LNKTNASPLPPAAPSPAQAAPAWAAPLPVRRITSASLFQGTHTEVQIEHQQQVYRLRVTALGKLILTK
jgi:hemin uptake protein HemP